MKSQLVILLILVSSLLATNADQQYDNLLQQYVQFKNECTLALITINSCCDLIGFPLSKAPSADQVQVWRLFYYCRHVL